MKALITSGITALAFMVYSGPTYAYLDPGAASIILQGIIAVIAGAAVTWKLYWRRIKSVFGSKFSVADSPKQESSTMEHMQDDRE